MNTETAPGTDTPEGAASGLNAGLGMDCMKTIGRMIPCTTGGTFENDPPDAIVSALVDFVGELLGDAVRYKWLSANMYVDDGILCILPDIYCHRDPNKAEIDMAIDRVMPNA